MLKESLSKPRVTNDYGMPQQATPESKVPFTFPLPTESIDDVEHWLRSDPDAKVEFKKTLINFRALCRTDIHFLEELFCDNLYQKYSYTSRKGVDRKPLNNTLLLKIIEGNQFVYLKLNQPEYVVIYSNSNTWSRQRFNFLTFVHVFF